MSKLEKSQQLCECPTCCENRKLVSWLDSNSLSYSLSKGDLPVITEAMKKAYRREMLFDLVRIMAIQNARKDHDNGK